MSNTALTLQADAVVAADSAPVEKSIVLEAAIGLDGEWAAVGSFTMTVAEHHTTRVREYLHLQLSPSCGRCAACNLPYSSTSAVCCAFNCSHSSKAKGAPPPRRLHLHRFPPPPRASSCTPPLPATPKTPPVHVYLTQMFRWRC